MRGPYTVTWYPDGEAEGQAKKFLEGLSRECDKKFEKLKRFLEFRGDTLSKTEMLKHVDGDVLELRDLCDGGALRIYLFRDGLTFYLVCGEVKNGRSKADSALVSHTQKCCDKHGETKK